MFEKSKEMVANLLIVVAAIGIVWNIGLYFSRAKVVVNAPIVGSELRIKGFDETGAQVNVLLFLSTGCKFCKESMSFYSRIARLASPRKIKFVALFKHTDDKVSEYLDQFKLVGVEVHRGDFDSLGIKGTPTLVLQDQSGKVIQSSVGKLDGKGEEGIENYLKSVLVQ